MSLCVHQQTLAFTAHFEMDLHGRKIWASAEALGEGGVVATGTALFVEVVR